MDANEGDRERFFKFNGEFLHNFNFNDQGNKQRLYKEN